MPDWNLVLGNPFWLGSIPFAYIGWIITFIGQCVDAANGANFSLSWWVLVFNLLLITGALLVIANDSIKEYRIVVTAFLAISIAYTSDQVSNFLARSVVVASAAAIAAGNIFMIIVMFTWVFAFGSIENSIVSTQLNSYSVSAKSGPGPTLPIINNATSDLQYPSHQGGIPMGTVGDGYATGAQPMGGYGMSSQQPVNSNTEYAFRAKALYAYEANQDDPNELSFAKGDMLDIVDNKGKWWQARKEDGTVGIAPSNYLQIT